MRRSVALLGLPLMMIVSGCGPAGTDPAGPGGPADSSGRADDRRAVFERRAGAAAQAWQPGGAWTNGYVPLQEPTVLVGEANFTAQTKTAFLAGWYQNTVELPAAKPADGAVRFPDGATTVPLISATEAYQQLDQGGSGACSGPPMDPATPPPAAPGGEPDNAVSSRPQGDCVRLTITKVELGTAPVHTTRGEAQVPAWLFTVPQIEAVVARVAVAPGAVGALPEPSTPPGAPPTGLVSAQDIEAIDGTKLTYRLGVGSCDTEITPLVQEYDHLVVVGGTVTPPVDGCDDMLNLHPVEVTLSAPVGVRLIVDALTGAPLRLAAA
ncbi:hypothetical protein E0H26_28275 [Micromonospora zingiberis]|uniref:Lipoprotein n=1 Tax=Micromonospora zingiberis TaxID=2053011 RepID=A0A4R0FZR0_9ACTN|nr:hypothetical protein [Micromonospora zingiberis]TCB88743.1 hypothetical protein E0H26_28275 [Micromonospora zingiberis]